MYTDHSYYHLIKNHYNCFGFNIFDIEQSRKLKIDIFGGIEEMKDWKSYAFINKKKSDHDT